MKRFRKRKTIKLTLAMAVVAAVAVPVAQADPQPLQKLENGITSVGPISDNSPQFSAAHQALLDRQQGGLLPGVNAAGLRYKALAKHYQQTAATGSQIDIKQAWARSQALTAQAAGVNADGLRYQALAQHYAQLATGGNAPSPISDNSPAFGHGGPQVVASPAGSGSSFDWGDAAAGFGVAIGLMLLMGVGVALVGRGNRTATA